MKNNKHNNNLAIVIACNIIAWFNTIAYFYINSPVYETGIAAIMIISTAICTASLVICLVIRANRNARHNQSKKDTRQNQAPL